MATLERTMFREYDIRGLVNPQQMNPSSVRLLAQAYGTMLRERGITRAVAGFDFRPSSQEICEAAVDGLASTGVDVIHLGMVITPMMYFAQYEFDCEGGLMVTASHNPSDWSGLKLAVGYSRTLGPDEIRAIHTLTTTEAFATGRGTVRHESIMDAYVANLRGRVSMKKPVRVVVNAGNGTAGPVATRVLREIGCDVQELYCDLDWTFPRYFPNPSSVRMMADTGDEVKRTKSDLGFAIDGDGDRLGVTDERGEVVWPDRFLILLARKVLAAHPGAKIVFDVKCSAALPEDIAAHGGVPIMWKTGHSYIKQRMWEEGAPLAGEMSGHIFFGKPVYYGFDDAVFAALKLAEYLSQSAGGGLAEALADTPTYISTPTFQVRCADEVKYEVVGRLVDQFRTEGYNVVDISGARVEFGDGWGLVRASSNLPVLGLRFEARTQERLDQIIELFRQKLAQFPEVGREWEHE